MEKGTRENSRPGARCRYFVEASLSLAAATYSRGRHGSPNDVTKTSQENYRAGHLLEVVTPGVWSIY